jgi:peroxiredoxin
VRNGTIAIVATLVFSAGCTFNGLPPNGQSGQPAPDFSLRTLNGEKIALSKFRGEAVVLDFWATWCLPCRERLPHLQALAADQGLARKGLIVLAIDEQEKSSDVRSFLDQFCYTFTVLGDTDGLVARTYSVSSLPTTIVVGRDGNIQSVITAVTSDSAPQLDGAIARALQ